jgi:Glycosyl hydrolase family 26
MPHANRNVLVAVALGLALVAGVKGFVPAETSSASPMTAPTLFGMDVPSPAALDASESALGVRAAIVGTYSDWAHAPDFPSDLARRINARGAVPLISWEPWDSWQGGTDQPAYALRRIAGGDFDALIDRWAAQIAAFHRPVMLRFAAEMNGDWLPWSTGVNDNADGDYVAAWRHVRARFRRAGAANAVWVWNPVAVYDGSTPLRALFPGADEVDWLAVDGFNWGATRSWGWQSYSDVFGPTMSAFRRLAPRRPVMIAETGCAPDPRRASWVAATLNAARADGVDALVWFEFDKEADWRLSASAAAARSARAVIGTSAWRRGGDLATVERAIRR